MNMDHHLKLRHLSCFLEIARQGSVARAAEALNISQPAVSKTLKELESLLQTRLFDRGRSGVALTESGLAFMRYVGPGMQSLREGVRSLRAGEFDAGELRLGALSSVEADFMPAVIERLHREHPALRISVIGGPADYQLGLLRIGELDLVIGRVSDSPHIVGLRYDHLYSESMALVARARHPLLQLSAQTALSRIAAYPIVLPLPDTTIRRHADSMLVQCGVGVPTTRLETLSIALSRHYVLNTDAVWVAPFDAVTADIRAGVLVELDLGRPEPGGSIGVCSNPAIEAPLAVLWCREVLEQVGRERQGT